MKLKKLPSIFPLSPEETTKQRKEIINKRRDYNEKRITRRGDSREEDIHKKRIFTRRGFVRKGEINEENV